MLRKARSRPRTASTRMAHGGATDGVTCNKGARGCGLMGRLTRVRRPWARAGGRAANVLPGTWYCHFWSLELKRTAATPLFLRTRWHVLPRRWRHAVALRRLRSPRSLVQTGIAAPLWRSTYAVCAAAPSSRRPAATRRAPIRLAHVEPWLPATRAKELEAKRRAPTVAVPSSGLDH